MKYLLSNKVEVFLVTGAWFIAGGLVVASYFTATTPTARLLAVSVLILLLIVVIIYIQSVTHRARNQKIIDSYKEEYEQTRKETEKIRDELSIFSNEKIDK